MNDVTEKANDLFWRLSREEAIKKMSEALLGLKWVVGRESASRIDDVLHEVEELLEPKP